MKAYIKYRMKQAVLPTIIMLSIMLTLYLVTLFASGLEPYRYESVSNKLYLRDLQLFYFPLFSMFLAVIVAIMQTNYLKTKKSADLYLSLPIKRQNLLIIHLLIGLLQIITILIVIFISSVIAIYLITIPYKDLYQQYDVYYHMLAFVPYFLLTILFTTIAYIISAFIYLKANSMVDGLIMIGLTAASMMILPNFIASLIGHRDYLDGTYFSPYSPLFAITNYFSAVIERDPISHYSKLRFTNFYLPTICLSAISLISLGGIYIHSIKYKTEDIEQVTESYFGYKVLIPFLTISIIALTDYTYDIFYIVVVMIASLLGYMLYQKTIKLKPRYYLIWGVSLFIGFLLASIVSTIN